MPCLEINMCKNFKINRVSFCVNKRERLTREDFKLIKGKHRKYKKLVPNHKEYIFLKVLDTGKIISAIGNLLKTFKLKEKDLVNKNFEEIEECSTLFLDFIEPLFNSCLENETAYQFDFTLKDKKYSCSLYPCPIPDIVSVDIVIRPSQNAMVDKDTSKFVLV